MKYSYGWIPDRPDFRDLKLKDQEFYSLTAPETLPATIDLREKMPAMYDQGQLGDCVGNSIAAACQYDWMTKKQWNDLMPSRLFLYYNVRVVENSVASDAGMSISDAFRSLNKTGICREDLWPYDIAKFADKPTSACYSNCKLHKAFSYYSVDQNLNSIKQSLNNGFPVVIGISVYDSFESEAVATNGIVPMPQPSESNLGGHCVMIVGYQDSTKQFIVRNSWGSSWGLSGYFYLPYEYIDPANNLASDFWTLKGIY